MKNKLLKINIIFILLIYFINKAENFSTFKDLDDELIDIQKYVDFIFNGTLIDQNKNFFLTDNPKISVIISVFNGEAYIQTALLSIQNQDFKDLEIIIIDDGSTDNSVKLIKKLMTNEPRIVLFAQKLKKVRANLSCFRYIKIIKIEVLYILKLKEFF